MTEAILLVLFILALLSVLLKDLLSAVICLGVFSLLSSLLFYLWHAPDVAIAEAAVGAGVATVLFVWTIRRTQRNEKK
jgi:energy-converting hydrogenase B subunit D